MFLRRKQKAPQGPSSPEHSSSPVFEPTLAEQSAERIVAISNLYGDYLNEAASKGLNKDEVKASLVDAWNSGAMPRVVPGETYRGSGKVVKLLHGDVPPDVFGYFDDENSRTSSVTLPGELDHLGRPAQEGSIEFGMQMNMEAARPPSKPNPENPNAFYVETITLPQNNTDEFDDAQVKDYLSKVDALAVTPEAK